MLNNKFLNNTNLSNFTNNTNLQTNTHIGLNTQSKINSHYDQRGAFNNFTKNNFNKSIDGFENMNLNSLTSYENNFNRNNLDFNDDERIKDKFKEISVGLNNFLVTQRNNDEQELVHQEKTDSNIKTFYNKFNDKRIKFNTTNYEFKRDQVKSSITDVMDLEMKINQILLTFKEKVKSNLLNAVVEHITKIHQHYANDTVILNLGNNTKDKEKSKNVKKSVHGKGHSLNLNEKNINTIKEEINTSEFDYDDTLVFYEYCLARKTYMKQSKLAKLESTLILFRESECELLLDEIKAFFKQLLLENKIYFENDINSKRNSIGSTPVKNTSNINRMSALNMDSINIGITKNLNKNKEDTCNNKKLINFNSLEFFKTNFLDKILQEIKKFKFELDENFGELRVYIKLVNDLLNLYQQN